ncbi:MAG: hypothetical protein CVT75_07950 [Alphaproteobacteria bacterium HGW-Alphaproteobacteria-14]|nr:MAG: hypothetical protein CVT75_07950 [Alphaproteobacteria bacterium HGW-Alphaproteobacteria-14]
MALNTRALALAGAVAGATFFASPAAAAALPTAGLGVASAAFDHSRYDPASATADYRCRWGCSRGHHRGYRRGRVGAGDVLIGAAIIGGIAAIANSNNRRQRDRDRDVVIVERDANDPNYNPRYQERRSDDRRAAPRGTGSSGLDSAVNQCLTRIERDVRVDSVDNVQRTGAGWLVSGALFDGSGFQCRIGNSGQIEGIDYGGGFSGAAPATDSDRAEGQLSDQRYADARLAMGGMAQPQAVAPSAPTTPVVAGPMPAYPGGPIPGEEIPETIDGDL